MTESECFDGKLVLQASAVEMIEPKQMDEHTAERILGHLLCWESGRPRDVRVDHQERQKRDLSAGKGVRALAAAEARVNAPVGTHCLDELVLSSRLIVAYHRARAAPFERVVLLYYSYQRYPLFAKRTEDNPGASRPVFGFSV